jgi:hypothetical protein
MQSQMPFFKNWSFFDAFFKARGLKQLGYHQARGYIQLDDHSLDRLCLFGAGPCPVVQDFVLGGLTIELALVIL